jgi:hypothetical protein
MSLVFTVLFHTWLVISVAKLNYSGGLKLFRLQFCLKYLELRAHVNCYGEKINKKIMNGNGA